MSTDRIRSTRRDFLGSFATGIGGIALADLLLGDGKLLAANAGRNVDPRANRVIHVFLQGGLSHLDSWDYKPELERRHGEPMPDDEKPDVFGKKVGLLHRPFWKFRRHGQSGLWGSELFPHLCGHIDKFAFIRSMIAPTGNHTPATYVANCGFSELGFPSMGAWLSYGLGSTNANLPGFVVLGDPRGMPAGGPNLWGSGFLPAQHQGVAFRSTGSPIADLNPARRVSQQTRNARFALLEEINGRYLASRGGAESALQARMKSYELAARMQLTVPEATSIEGESARTRTLYGIDRKECAEFGRMCLLSRRLVERGVRFVQLWSGATLAQPTWDSHGNLDKEHWREAVRIDRPLSGLLYDLHQRGLLDDTLVVFSTEFGRTPFTEVEKGKLGSGRDHNQTAFTNWLAGAGVRGGSFYGATDELGFRAVENPVTVHDFHATILHLMGLDHERLTYPHSGRDFRLTDVYGKVVEGVLA